MENEETDDKDRKQKGNIVFNTLKDSNHSSGAEEDKENVYPQLRKEKAENKRDDIGIEIEDVINLEKNRESKLERKRSNIFGTLKRSINPTYTEEELNTLRKARKPSKESTVKTYDAEDDSHFGRDSPTSASINKKGVIIKKFNDYRPENKEYFTKPIIEVVKRKICAVIPFFNEPAHEVQQTLISLNNTYSELIRLEPSWRNGELHVCLIQDGWHKAHNTMKDYIKDMFPKKIKDDEGEEVDWWDYFEEFQNKASEDATFIFERRGQGYTSINVQEGLKDDRKLMRITLIIKIQNRRKHNSHEWGLAKNGFAETMDAEYIFLTDAFTLYSESCLWHLIRMLDADPKLSAVTGRQRLMTREQQGSGESVFSFGNILRKIQLFDFELANAVYNGAFHIGGLLPVIPGPCGIYRRKYILQDAVRNAYFEVVNKNPDETGLIVGNLKIAEDRLLTFLSVTKTTELTYMAFCPLAVFYFEAETELSNLIFQRRRWINGSIAGYIYLLFLNFNDFKQWDAPVIRKLYVWILLMCQFLIYCMMSIQPGISIKILYYGVNYFLNYYGINWNLQLLGLFVLLWAIYLGHVIIHYRDKFNYMIMYLLVFLSFCTSITSFASLFHYAFIAKDQTILEILTGGNPIVYLALGVLITPFILALMLSGKGHSFMYMLQSFIPYILFLPLMIGWFGSYAYARTWDLTWGNRPSSELSNVTEEQKNIMMTKFKEKSIRIIIALVILNIVVFFIPLEGQFILMSCFFALALYQMFFSFIYCISKIGYKIKTIYYRCKNDTNRLIDQEIEV